MAAPCYLGWDFSTQQVPGPPPLPSLGRRRLRAGQRARGLGGAVLASARGLPCPALRRARPVPPPQPRVWSEVGAGGYPQPGLGSCRRARPALPRPQRGPAGLPLCCPAARKGNWLSSSPAAISPPPLLLAAAVLLCSVSSCVAGPGCALGALRAGGSCTPAACHSWWKMIASVSCGLRLLWDTGAACPRLFTSLLPFACIKASFVPFSWSHLLSEAVGWVS